MTLPTLPTLLTLLTLLPATLAQTGAYLPPITPDPVFICPLFQFNSETRFDCSRTTCAAPLNSTGVCLQFCEVRRTGIVGPVQVPNTTWNGTTNSWEGKDLPEGELIDVWTGVNQTGFMGEEQMKAVRGSVNYEFSSSPTLKTRTIKVKVEDTSAESTRKWRQEQGYKVRWVYFPLLIETCGTMLSQKHNASLVTGVEKCSGDVKAEENSCVTGVWTINGEAVVAWAQRFEHPNGTVVWWGNQTEDYERIRHGSYLPIRAASDAIALRVGGILFGAFGVLAAMAI